MHIFYSDQISQNAVTLSPEESQHCIKVLRMNAGDKAMVIDGKGGMFVAEILVADPRKCVLQIGDTITVKKRLYNLQIAIAPTKNIDRFEWFLEKAVEIGIDTITPILCQRSERRVLKIDRLQKLIISAMKQAMLPKLPVLNELTDFRSFISHIQGHTVNRYIAHCEAQEKVTLKESLIHHEDVLVLIGPEGDFTTEEIAMALQHGFKPLSLGDNRLRTETAGIHVCSMVRLINE